MKFLRLQIPRNFLHELGLADIFKNIESLEIISAYQYDQKNFFSLQKITFQRGLLSKINPTLLSDMIAKKMGTIMFELIEQMGDTVLCIMKQSRETGFWPSNLLGPWAFLFPITVTGHSIIISIMVEEEYLEELKEVIGRYTADYGILAQGDMDKAGGESIQRGLFNLPTPAFTDRQREIAAYAAKKGYFESPKRISADEIASHFQITVSAVNENLRKAEHLAMKFFFGTPEK
jgi:hypothetical protein